MKVTLAVPLLLLPVSLGQTASEDADKVLRDSRKATREIAAILKTIKDVKSAEAAVPRLEAPAKALAQAYETSKKLDKAAAKALQELEVKNAKELAEEHLAYTSEWYRLKPEWRKAVEKSTAWTQLQVVQDEAWTQKAKAELQILERAIKTYKATFSDYPKELMQLVEPVDGKAIIQKCLLVDPWGFLYQYEPNTLHPKTRIPYIYSLGPPGKDKIIANWEVK
jgi:hypothetical protein